MSIYYRIYTLKAIPFFLPKALLTHTHVSIAIYVSSLCFPFISCVLSLPGSSLLFFPLSPPRLFNKFSKRKRERERETSFERGFPPLSQLSKAIRMATSLPYEKFFRIIASGHVQPLTPIDSFSCIPFSSFFSSFFSSSYSNFYSLFNSKVKMLEG